MEKKLKINFILKGIAVFAFVAFCLLAILSGVTLPFVSNASTVDYATASVESNTFNPLDFCIPLSQCNTTDNYYGVYITEDFYNMVTNYNLTDYDPHIIFSTEPHSYDLFIQNAAYYNSNDEIVYGNFIKFGYGVDVFFYNVNTAVNVYNYISHYSIVDSGFKISHNSDTFYNAFKDYVYVFTSIPSVALQTQVNNLTAEKNALQNQLSNMNFMSHFGNFDNLGSSDFYVNLSSVIVLPEIFYQFTNNSTPINGWFKMGEGANMSIYGLNLFDRFYYNGTEESGLFNCGFQLTRKSIPSTTMPPTYTIKGTLQFIVFDTLIWSADCDFDYNTDTKVESITNIRNGSFKVSSNYDKDTNVYKFTAPSDKLFLLNENYNKSYDIFRSYIVQQDYKKTRIPSDNALYLNGYQSASKDFYNNGYNDGVVAGEKSGYNKGFTAGDAQGYNRGVEVGGNYSFLGLFGAIFDAPIQAIFGGTTTLPAGTTITDKNGNTTTLLSSATVKRAGLLNFEIMGVNLSGFVLALFSLSILVLVIKFALGKGR